MATYRCAGSKRKDENEVPYCTYEAPKPWRGQCPECHRWYDVIQIGVEGEKKGGRSVFDLADTKEVSRISTGFGPFDDCLGGDRATGKPGGLVDSAITVVMGGMGHGDEDSTRREDPARNDSSTTG